MERALRGEEDVEHMPGRETEEETDAREERIAYEEILQDVEVPRLPEGIFRRGMAWLPFSHASEKEEERDKFEDEDVKEAYEEAFTNRKSPFANFFPFPLPDVIIHRKSSLKRSQGTKNLARVAKSSAPAATTPAPSRQQRSVTQARPAISRPRPLLAAAQPQSRTQKPPAQTAKKTTTAPRPPGQVNAQTKSRPVSQHRRVASNPVPTSKAKVSMDSRDSEATKVENVKVTWDWGEYWGGHKEAPMDEEVGRKQRHNRAKDAHILEDLGFKHSIYHKAKTNTSVLSNTYAVPHHPCLPSFLPFTCPS
ncbi:hypothetical protein BT69DRAFT_392651 [Atractiella rhizophila]|nr:hypothetical protein BT69DRAFT_392651 [Atractiella rhizophila]